MPQPLFDRDAIDALAKQLAVSQDPVSAAPPPDTGASKWPYAALLGGQGADALTTLIATRNPNLVEQNPLGVAGTMAAKAGLTAAVAGLMHHLNSTGHEKAAKVVGTMTGLAGAIPAAWNVSQMQKVQ